MVNDYGLSFLETDCVWVFHKSSTLTKAPRSTGVWGVEKVTVISESVKVTASPLNAGKITGTIAGGQIEVSSLPSKYVMR